MVDGALEGALTYGDQVPVVLQHHLFVEIPLLGAQQGPLLLGEVQCYILERHWVLKAHIHFGSVQILRS